MATQSIDPKAKNAIVKAKAKAKVVYDDGTRYKVTGKSRKVAPSKAHPATKAAKKPAPKASAKAPSAAKPAAVVKTPAQIQEEAVAASLGNIDKPITGPALEQTAQTLVDHEYAPVLAGLSTQEAKVAAQRDQQQKWAQGISSGINSLFGSTQAAQVKANADTAAAVAAARAAHIAEIGKAQDATTARLAADASVRGAGLDGGAGAQAAQTTQQATDRAASQGAAQSALAQQTGATQEAFLHGLASAAAMRGGETQAAIGTAAGNQLADIGAQRTKLDSDRLGRFTDTVMKLRNQEREGWLTQQGIASGVEKARLDAKVDLASVKSKAQLDRQKLDFEAALKVQGWSHDDAKAQADREFKSAENALDRGSREGIAAASIAARAAAAAAKEGDKKAKAKYTPAQQQKVVSNVRNAASAAKQMIAAGGVSSSQIRSILEGNTKVKGLPTYRFDHDVVNAAMDLASPSKGYLSPANVRYLHGYGIVLQNYGLPTKPKKQAAAPGIGTKAKGS